MRENEELDKNTYGHTRDLAMMLMSIGPDASIELPMNIIKTYPKGWDCYRDIVLPSGVTTNVFKEWVKYYAKRFFSNVDNSSKDEILELVKMGIQWWLEEHGPPPNDKRSLYIKKITNQPPLANDNILVKNNRYLADWYDVWLDTGWVTESRLLSKILFNCIIDNNVKTTARLLRDKLLDVKTTYVCFEDIQTYEKEEEICDSVGVGFLVNSLEMAKLLTRFGIDWEQKDSLGVPMYISLLNYKDNASPTSSFKDKNLDFDARLEIAEYLYSIVNHKELDKEIIYLIKHNAKSTEDIKVILDRNSDWVNLLDSDGKNVLHILAKDAPVYVTSYIINKYGKEEEIIKLLNTQDKSGKYPIEYIVAFHRNKGMDEIFDFINRTNSQKPNWINAKIIEEENADVVICSDFSDFPAEIWSQTRIETMKDLLRNKNSSKFLNLANKRLKTYGFINYCDWFHPALSGKSIIAKNNFLKTASNIRELKLAVLLSFAIIYDCEWREPEVIVDSRDTALKLIKKAAISNIDVAKIKEDILSYQFDSGNDVALNSIMEDKIPIWRSLREEVERLRLRSVVDIKNIKSKNTDCLYL